MNFSEFLKQLRTDAGYTQQNIADLLGVNRSTYAYYELGKTEPAIRHLKKLACLYKLHMEDLVSCRFAPMELELSSAEGEAIDTGSVEKYRTLDSTEQQLILLYRSAEDKEAFLKHVRDFADQE